MDDGSEGCQLLHRLAWEFDKGGWCVVCHTRGTHDHSGIVDSKSETFAAAQCAQWLHLPVRENESLQSAGRGERLSDDHTLIVHPCDERFAAAERSDISHDPIRTEDESACLASRIF